MERAGGEPVTGRGWHGADARVWPRGLRGARERGAPGRGGDDGAGECTAEAALPNGESVAAVDGTAMPSSPVRPVVCLDVFRSPTPEDLACRTPRNPASPRTPKAGDGFRQRVVRSGTADSPFLHNQRRHVAQVANARLRKIHKQT